MVCKVSVTALNSKTIYDELLMWSHYANSGKGICLVYDKRNLFESNHKGYPKLIDVKYQDKLPEVNVFIKDKFGCFSFNKLNSSFFLEDLFFFTL